MDNSYHVYEKKDKNEKECRVHHLEFDFFLHEITIAITDNVYWRVNFVVLMESISDDARTSLKSIESNITNISAWDKIGTIGWSENEKGC